MSPHNDLKPYPAMKDSGLPWLGEVPEHWEVRRLKHICRFAYGDSLPAETRQQGEVAVFGSNAPIGFHTAANTRSPCIVVGRKGSFGKVNFSSEPVFAIDTTFFVDERFSNAHLRWLFYLLGWLRLDEVSKDSAVPGLDREDAYQRRGPYPPDPAEQIAIVRFLDYADRRIRRAVRAKHKLIELLSEQKQAIIHQAVTRGLDPNVRLKASGGVWLGDVPKHWEVVRLKQVTTPIEQGWSPQCDAQPAGDDDWGVLKVGCVNRDTFDELQNKKLPSELDPVPALQIRDGDILVSRANTRELLGLAALVTKPRQKLMLCDKLFRFRAQLGRADPRFLVYAIRQKTSRAQIECSTNGASDSMQNIGQGVVRNLVVSLPPIDEQQKVVAALAKRTASLAGAMSQAASEVFLLREYRTRLIADVVTGKLDVRAAAAQLPVDPEAAMDEVSLLPEAEDIGDIDDSDLMEAADDAA